MVLYLETAPKALRSASVAPTLGGSVAGACPQNGFLRVDAHTQAGFPAIGDATATGPRSWSQLMT